MAGEVETTFIPFGELRPDSGEFMNDDLVEASGVYPIGDRYFPLQPLYARSDAISAIANPTIIRGHVAQGALNGVDKNYVAVDSEIYALDHSATPWAPNLMVNGLTIDSDGGQFCGFGSHEIFACGHTSPMQIRLLGAGVMVTCITSLGAGNDPRPKYVCPIGERILIGNLGNCNAAGAGLPDVNPDMVWWSGTRDPQLFGTAVTNPADRTGFNALNDDFGPITGMIGGKEYALIFKRRAIVRMDFGGAYGFSFRWIPQSYGCLSHLSICALGRDVYFWSDAGPCVYRDDQVIPLAYGKMALELLETKLTGVNYSPSLVGCGVDPVNQLVWWCYTYLGTYAGASNLRFRKLVYSPGADRFSLAIDMPLIPTTVLSDSGGSQNSEQIVACWDGLNTTGLPLAGGVFAINNYTANQLKLYTYSGELGDRWWYQNGSLVTGYFPLKPRGSTRIQRIRPVIRMKTGATIPDLSVTINVKNKPWDVPTPYGPFALSTAGDSRGYITCPSVPSSQLIQIALTFPRLSQEVPFETNPYSSIREIEGLQIEFVPGGEKL